MTGETYIRDAEVPANEKGDYPSSYSDELYINNGRAVSPGGSYDGRLYADLYGTTGADVVEEKVGAREQFRVEDNQLDETDVMFKEERCGFFCFKPDFMQRFKNMKVFLLVFIIAGMSQAMYWSYWNMTLSSIEKRLQIPSQTTGIITAINEVSHMAVVLLVAHYCGKGHRPRWLAVGSLIVGVAVSLFATPELFATKWDAGGLTSVSANLSEPKIDRETCLTLAQAKLSEEKCDTESEALRNDILWPIILLAIAQSLLGIGTTTSIVLAMPFIDDNVKMKNAPIYFALGLAGRFIGPVIGVMLGGFCLSIYVDLTKPRIAQTDPRWMGAWWLGYIVMGVTICLTSTLYLCFPRSLSRQTARRSERVPALTGSKTDLEPNKPVDSKAKFSDLLKDIKRLLVNKIYMCRLFNDCIDMLVVSGYYSFASKYIEFHFRVSPATAGQASGLASILAMGTGAVVGGVLMRKFKLQPKQVALGVIISSFLTAICYLFLMMIKCEPRVLHSTWGADGMLRVDTPCSNECNCVGKSFSPVCDEKYGVSYYSPCHAGCTGSWESLSKNQSKYYTNCRCLTDAKTLLLAGITISDRAKAPTPTLFTGLIQGTKIFLVGSDSATPSADGTVKRGFCEGSCDGLWIYLAISATFNFVGMLPFSGSQMLAFRIVEPDLKALSNGVKTLTASLFAFIPGPIIMGTLIDSTCKLWNTVACGRKGACLVYDLDGLRLKMHLYVGVIKMFACLLDIYVFFKVRNMTFEREPVKTVQEAEDDQAVEQTSRSLRNLTATS